MKKTKRKRKKLGDVYAIPLPNGSYAFGRIFKDASIAIYKHIGENKMDLPKTEDYQFIVGVYNDVITNEDWEKIENRPFDSDIAAWPPKKYILDSISGEYSIYYRGEILPSSKTECIGLEVASVWDKHHIIGRIMGETKWIEKC